MSRLDVFVAPKPNLWLINAMTGVNRVVMLKGVAGLRDMAPFNRLAGLRGISDVRTIDFPEAERARLAAVCGPGKATFFAPNHPEFFTDWMIDKEIASRVCPLAAFWATNGVVNGLGLLAQKFWLANNLIAQIPGNSEPRAGALGCVGAERPWRPAPSGRRCRLARQFCRAADAGRGRNGA